MLYKFLVSFAIENLRQPSFLPQKPICGYKYMSIGLLIFILFFSQLREEILSISISKFIEE